MRTGLEISNLSKRFGTAAALESVSLRIRRGEPHALLGGNGSGKSTLIKVLAGVHAAEPGGRITVGERAIQAEHTSPAWARAAGLSFVHQDLGLFEVMSVAENLFAGEPYPRRGGRIDWPGVRRAAQATLDQLGIAVQAELPLARLRPADRTLVAIARALHGRESFHEGVLVLDEPTARLPEPEVEMLIGALRGYAEQGQTILYVTHRLDEVFALAHGVTVLRDGRVVASRPVQGLTEQELVALIVGQAEPTAGVPGPAPGVAFRAGAPVLELEGLTAGPIREVSLRLRGGEVVGVAGLVGSGRTSLLEAIYGGLPVTSGRVRLDGHELGRHSIASAIRSGMCYVPEDRATHGGFLTLGIPENLSAGDPRQYFRRLWFRHGAERSDAMGLITRYGVKTPAPSATLAMLSGGNQQKVIVARWLRSAPRLLLLDEPTQGVDVAARADIHAHIRAAVSGGAAALLVSSDFDELLALSDRVVVLCSGRLTVTADVGSIDRHWLTERVYAIPEEVAA